MKQYTNCLDVKKMSLPVMMDNVLVSPQDVTRLSTAEMSQMRETVDCSIWTMVITKTFLLLAWYSLSSLNEHWQNLNNLIYIFHFKDDKKNIIPTNVNVSTSLQTVIDISERTHIIELKFEMKQEWYEDRAKYYNLKDNYVFNVLSYAEMRELWIPYIIFKVRKAKFLLIISCIFSEYRP